MKLEHFTVFMDFAVFGGLEFWDLKPWTWRPRSTLDLKGLLPTPGSQIHFGFREPQLGAGQLTGLPLSRWDWIRGTRREPPLMQKLKP